MGFVIVIGKTPKQQEKMKKSVYGRRQREEEVQAPGIGLSVHVSHSLLASRHSILFYRLVPSSSLQSKNGEEHRHCCQMYFTLSGTE